MFSPIVPSIHPSECKFAAGIIPCWRSLLRPLYISIYKSIPDTQSRFFKNARKYAANAQIHHLQENYRRWSPRARTQLGSLRALLSKRAEQDSFFDPRRQPSFLRARPSPSFTESLSKGLDSCVQIGGQ